MVIFVTSCYQQSTTAATSDRVIIMISSCHPHVITMSSSCPHVISHVNLPVRFQPRNLANHHCGGVIHVIINHHVIMSPSCHPHVISSYRDISM
eukprot:3201009-Amphidinium_carterae.1